MVCGRCGREAAVVIWQRGRYQVVAVWNGGVVAFTFGLWRYRLQDDARAWFLRWRVGPWKLEVTKRR